jgi:hypothetical protein
MKYQIPEVSTSFFCIVDRDRPDLAAVISSYLSKKGEYLPLFEFPVATTAKGGVPDDHIDEHTITRRRSIEFNVNVLNSIGKIGTTECVVLAGLSAIQRSYLTFPETFNILEIGELEDIDFALAAFSPEKDRFLPCAKEELHLGLVVACSNNMKLRVDSYSDAIVPENHFTAGLVIIEQIPAVSVVIAINYSFSIGATAIMVEPLEKYESREIEILIENWRLGSDIDYQSLAEKVDRRVGQIPFDEFEFASFFTEGIPYSVILKDVIPFSYVNILARPDLFILNNLLYEKKPEINAAILFSPELFVDEEITFIKGIFETSKYYIKELTGANATVFNLDMHVKEFPYDLLHICSHGGEVPGCTITEEFVDRNGISYVVEYDLVFGFAPIPGQELVMVSKKMLWRKLDGIEFGSHEFIAKKYANHIFVDMQLEIEKHVRERQIDIVHKEFIANSCSVHCSDHIYQALFDIVSSYHTSPFIFNNSCWSWSAIAESFLFAGVRGYIGTLWNIDTDVASAAAKEFYSNIKDSTILKALHQSRKVAEQTNSENVYIFWGLHFATITEAEGLNKSRKNVCKFLLNSYDRWNEKEQNAPNEATRRNIKQLANWDFDLLFEDFRTETRELHREWRAEAQKRQTL